MRKVTTPQVATPDQASRADLPDSVKEALSEIAGAAKEGLLALSVGVGLGVMAELMEAEVDEVVGPKGRHDAERGAVRHGHEPEQVTLGGRRVGVRRPRKRAADGSGEPGLHPPLRGSGRASRLRGRAIGILDLALGGLPGLRRGDPHGPWRADVEAPRGPVPGGDDGRRRRHRRSLLRRGARDHDRGGEGPDRGLDPEQGILFVIDGSKALRRAIADVFGLRAPVGLSRTLGSTNPIESMIEIVRHIQRNVKSWQSGDMRLRWTAAGMLCAERQFRRIIGYRDLATLALAVEREVTAAAVTSTEAEEVIVEAVTV